MITKRKSLSTLLVIAILVVAFSSSLGNVSAHTPRYIDLKYYDEENVLSVYVTHGVSDSTYHYVDRITIEVLALPASMVEEFTTDEKWLLKSPDQELEESKFGKYWIQEADVYDDPRVHLEDATLVLEANYTEQVNHQINHYNYTDMDYPEWTLFIVTAYCNSGGSYTNALIVGHPWYDIEHSMLEAVVPTLICSVIVLTPLALWRISNKKKEGAKH